MTPVGRVSISFAVVGAAIGASWPYLTIYYQSLGLNLAMIGGLTALAAATQMVSAPLWGAVSDRAGSGRLVPFLPPAVAAVGAFSLAFASTAPTVVATVVLLNLGTGGIAPLLDSRALGVLGADRFRYGRIRACSSIGFVVAACLVGALIDRSRPAQLFAVWVPALIVTALSTLALPRRGPERAVNVFRGARDMLRQRSLAAFLLSALLMWLTLSAANAFYSIYMISLGGSAQAVGLVWAIGALVEVPVMWAFPALGARFGGGNLLVIAGAVFALRAAAVAAFASPASLIAIAAVQGLGTGLFFAGAVTHVGYLAPRRFAATAQGIYGAVVGLGAIAGSFLAGLVASAAGLNGLYWACALASGLAAAVMWSAVRSSREPAPVQDSGSAAGIA